LRQIRSRQNRFEADLDRVQGFAPTHAEAREMADLAARHEQLFADLELGASPEPRSGESPFAYSRRLLEKLQPFSPSYRNVRLDRIEVGGGLAPVATAIV